MINGNEEFSRDILRKILKKSGTESPTPSFTDKVMKSVYNETLDGLVVSEKYWFSMTRIVSGLFIVFSMVALGYFFYKYGSNLVLKDIDPLFIPVVKDLYKSLVSIFQSIQISSITVVIIGGFIFLLGLEYLLRKYQFFKNSYFSF